MKITANALAQHYSTVGLSVVGVDVVPQFVLTGADIDPRVVVQVGKQKFCLTISEVEAQKEGDSHD